MQRLLTTLCLACSRTPHRPFSFSISLSQPHQRMAEGILGLWPVFAMIALAVLGYYAVLYDMEFELKSQAF